MNKRSLRKNILLLFIVVLFSVGTGYAYLNSTLYINGTSIISANVWDVSLDNLNITGGSVVAIQEPITSDTATTFTVKLSNKEDFYEFTVDVVNNGEHDAKLGSLVETTGLTSEQEQYFDYNLTYQNNEPIQVNQIVKKDEFVRLKSKVEYKEEVNITSVPESVKTLNLGFKLNYDLDDGAGVIVNNNGREKVKPIANGDITEIGTVVTIGTENFYTIGTEGDNVKLLSMYNLHVGNIIETGDIINLITKPTGMQDVNAKGCVRDSNGFIMYPLVGITPFSSDLQHGNSYSDYKGSIVETYVNNYKKILENSFGVEINSARIIKFEELTSDQIGCSLSQWGFYCNSSPYLWIYSTSYWIGTSSNSEYIYSVVSNGDILEYMYNNSINFGVRPVIIVKKSDIV